MYTKISNDEVEVERPAPIERISVKELRGKIEYAKAQKEQFQIQIQGLMDRIDGKNEEINALKTDLDGVLAAFPEMDAPAPVEEPTPAPVEEPVEEPVAPEPTPEEPVTPAPEPTPEEPVIPAEEVAPVVE